MKRLFSSKIFLCAVCFCAGIIVTVMITTNRKLSPNYQREQSENQIDHFDNDPISKKMNIFREKFHNNFNQSEKLFDDFFNDDFFKKFDNPFEEMDSVRKKMEKYFQDFTQSTDKTQFNTKFNSWFDTRFGGGKASDIQIREDKNHLYYEINIEHLADQNVKIDTQDNAVVISSRINREKQKTEKGIRQKTTHSARFFRSFPAPRGIDPDKTHVTIKGEQVSIRFKKKG